MKNRLFQSIKLVMAIAAMILCCACSKRSDGRYTPVNEAVITGMDTLYTVYPDSILHIKPTITYSLDAAGDTSNYTYEWIRLNNVGYAPTNSKVIATGPELNLRITASAESGWFLGAFEMSLRITDRRSKLFKEQFFILFVTNDIYEGYLLLCKENGGSRVDMLSYKSSNNRFELIKDVLKAEKSSLELQGTPNFIANVYSLIIKNNEFPYSKGSIFIGTSSGAWVLDRDQLNNVFDLSPVLYGGSFANQDTRMYPLLYWDLFYMNGKVYSGDTYFSDITYIQQKDGSKQPFTASPYVAVYYFSAQSPTVLFDTASGEFVWHALGLDYCSSFGKGNLFDYKTGKDLLYLTYSFYSNGQYVAVLKDRKDRSSYLARFNRFTQLSYKPIASTVIGQAEQFAVSPEYGTLFYSVGSRLYQYDDETGREKLMADYGPATISLLQFHNFLYASEDVTTPSYNKARYKNMQKQLLVCTFTPGNGTSGTLERFEVMPGLQPLKQIDKHTGFGEVAGLTYLER